MSQLALFRRDAGHASALSGLSPIAVRAIRGAVESFAGKPAFTSDMVWAALSFAIREQVAVHPNAVPAVIQHYAKRGLIERTGASVVSQRENARGRRVACWRFR